MNQKELLDFNQDLEKVCSLQANLNHNKLLFFYFILIFQQEEKLTEATKRLKDLKEQMMNCQSRIEAVALREEFLDLLDDAKVEEIIKNKFKVVLKLL